jgi:hypothetical protein
MKAERRLKPCARRVEYLSKRLPKRESSHSPSRLTASGANAELLSRFDPKEQKENARP